MSALLNALRRDERGMGMVLVVYVGAVASVLALTTLVFTQRDQTRADVSKIRGAAFQAAEAGVEDYVAKLVDNRLYYGQYVHPGEATRRDVGGSNVAPNTVTNDEVPWPYTLSWTYPSGMDDGLAWRKVEVSGTNFTYEYRLQIIPPNIAAGDKTVRVLAAGQLACTAPGVPKYCGTESRRTIETFVRPSSIADYYRVVDGDVGWGSGATTYGKIYANGDVNHDGTAQGNIYAEGQITGATTLVGGATKYDVDSNPNIRSQIEEPIDFTAFVTSFVDIQNAAAANSPSMAFTGVANTLAWRFIFNANGTVTVQRCPTGGVLDEAQTLPTCAAYGSSPYVIPSNGAIYATETVIVSGVVDGRVTVGSNDDIVIEGNISYETPGDDVLGLAAKNSVITANYAPSTLTWNAAVIAQSNTWHSYSGTQSKTTMNFTGMSATADGGYFTQFATRNYSYDDNLQYLPPPWFPVVGDAYVIQFFREI